MSFDPVTMLGSLDAGRVEALIDTMVLAAAADGEISAEEQNELAGRLVSVVSGTEQEKALSDDVLSARIGQTHGRISAGGRAAVIGEVRDRLSSEQERKAALGLAIAVTAADGIIRTSEREIIMELAEALGIEQGAAADLVREVTRTG